MDWHGALAPPAVRDLGEQTHMRWHPPKTMGPLCVYEVNAAGWNPAQDDPRGRGGRRAPPRLALRYERSADESTAPRKHDRRGDVRLSAKRVDLSKLLLVSRGFH